MPPPLKECIFLNKTRRSIAPTKYQTVRHSDIQYSQTVIQSMTVSHTVSLNLIVIVIVGLLENGNAHVGLVSHYLI